MKKPNFREFLSKRVVTREAILQGRLLLKTQLRVPAAPALCIPRIPQSPLRCQRRGRVWESCPTSCRPSYPTPPPHPQGTSCWRGWAGAPRGDSADGSPDPSPPLPSSPRPPRRPLPPPLSSPRPPLAIRSERRPTASRLAGLSQRRRGASWAAW